MLGPRSCGSYIIRVALRVVNYIYNCRSESVATVYDDDDDDNNIIIVHFEFRKILSGNAQRP